MYRFFIQMEKMLNEKRNKYKNDDWKKANLGFLKYKLDQQVKKPFLLDNQNKERTKRNMIHIANYCYFIFSKLNKEVDK